MSNDKSIQQELSEGKLSPSTLHLATGPYGANTIPNTTLQHDTERKELTISTFEVTNSSL